MAVPAPIPLSVKLSANLNDRLRSGLLPRSHITLTNEVRLKLSVKMTEKYRIDATNPGFAPLLRTHIIDSLSRAEIIPSHSDDHLRNFGEMTLFFEQYLFKIDCFDLDYTTLASKPHDETKSVRVCTIMMPHEY